MGFFINSTLAPRASEPETSYPRIPDTVVGLRYYFPMNGRWISADPMAARLNSATYFTFHNSPLNVFDKVGLWGESVHKKRTIEWAEADPLRMPASGAQLIGEKDDAVDTIWSTYTFSDENWKWHFNRSASGLDSRLEIGEKQLEIAESWCDWTKVQDDWKRAGTTLGYGLHAIQDYVAHGDFNRKTELPNPAAWPRGFFGYGLRHLWHNWDAPYRGAQHDPDNEDKDAIQGPDWPVPPDENGRPVIGAMAPGTTAVGAGTTYWTTFVSGNKRIALNRKMTVSRLETFMEFVRTNSKPCGECRKHFLP